MKAGRLKNAMDAYKEMVGLYDQLYELAKKQDPKLAVALAHQASNAGGRLIGQLQLEQVDPSVGWTEMSGYGPAVQFFGGEGQQVSPAASANGKRPTAFIYLHTHTAESSKFWAVGLTHPLEK